MACGLWCSVVLVRLSRVVIYRPSGRHGVDRTAYSLRCCSMIRLLHTCTHRLMLFYGGIIRQILDVSGILQSFILGMETGNCHDSPSCMTEPCNALLRATAALNPTLPLDPHFSLYCHAPPASPHPRHSSKASTSNPFAGPST